jgi:hypothetical protein
MLLIDPVFIPPPSGTTSRKAPNFVARTCAGAITTLMPAGPGGRRARCRLQTYGSRRSRGTDAAAEEVEGTHAGDAVMRRWRSMACAIFESPRKRPSSGTSFDTRKHFPQAARGGPARPRRALRTVSRRWVADVDVQRKMQAQGKTSKDRDASNING